MELGLGFDGARVADGRVEPDGVVEVVDVVTEDSLGLFDGVERRAIDAFKLKGGEEALRYGVVPAVALFAHAALHSH